MDRQYLSNLNATDTPHRHARDHPLLVQTSNAGNRVNMGMQIHGDHMNIKKIRFIALDQAPPLMWMKRHGQSLPIAVPVQQKKSRLKPSRYPNPCVSFPKKPMFSSSD
ncbi:MAG TPA: hypothetical protein ACQGQH_07165 [Xylella sp.]